MAWENGWVVPRIPKERIDKSVAVIGSGLPDSPRRILNQRGFHVTVFEKSEEPGGLLMLSRTNAERLRQRVDILKQEGITFVCNTDVGKDMPVSSWTSLTPLCFAAARVSRAIFRSPDATCPACAMRCRSLRTQRAEYSAAKRKTSRLKAEKSSSSAAATRATTASPPASAWAQAGTGRDHAARANRARWTIYT
ncbi:MAG: hypothetical protein R2881_05655 [Eubacteriales bacterium]